MTTKACPRASAPTDTNLAPNPSGKKRKKQNRNHCAPAYVQEMPPFLEELSIEQSANKRYVINRYRLLTFIPGGRSYGLAADIRFALVRIFDALRLYYHGREPSWLREWITIDSLTIGRLFASYSLEHGVWEINLTNFHEVENHKRLSEKDLKKILVACILLNFKCKQCYLRKNDVMIYGPTQPIEPRSVRKYVGSALKNMRLSENGSLQHSWKEVPVPGWNEACKTSWENASDVQPIDQQKSGALPCSLFRLVPVIRSGWTQTCVKGGGHV